MVRNQRLPNPKDRGRAVGPANAANRYLTTESNAVAPSPKVLSALEVCWCSKPRAVLPKRI